MRTMTWEEVLARDDLIGGDIESQEDGDVYRGPLAEIREEGDAIIFSSHWCARLNRETSGWEKWHITSLLVSKSMVTPVDAGTDRVFLSLPALGACTIFPKNGSKLDPSKVRGL